MLLAPYLKDYKIFKKKFSQGKKSSVYLTLTLWKGNNTTDHLRESKI